MNKFAQVSILGSLDLSKAMATDNIGAEDSFQYCLCCRTWFYVVQSFANARLASKVEAVVSSAGLFTALKSADTAAEAILSGTFRYAIYNRDSLFGLWAEICDAVSRESGCPDTDDWMAVACGIVLRFPKRFTITNSDRDNLDDFLQCQNKAHILNTDWSARPGETIMSHVAKNMQRILEDRYLELPIDLKPVIGWGQNPLHYLFGCYDEYCVEKFAPFSDGACFYPNLGIDKTSRISAYKTHFVCAAGYSQYYLRDALESGWPQVYSFVGENWPTEKISEHKYAALLSAVPKNYKERRMIAPETPVLNLIARKVRSALFETIDANGWMPYLNPTDQSINKELARVGSLYSGHKIKKNAYCTIDARHASDSIPRQLFFELLRYVSPFTRRLIRLGLADEIVYNRKYHYAPQILATSGSPLTPILQSIYYMAIVMTAYDLCGIKYEKIKTPWYLAHKIKGLDTDQRDVTKVPFAIYNDDIIVKQEAFETVVEMLTRFGITINETKTFSGDNHFRESCGGEYINGYDITGCYWPRKAIETNVNGRLKTSSLETIISLQHKLHEKNAWAASDYLCNVLRNSFSDMTASCIGSESQDLWEGWRSLYDDATQPHCKIVTQYQKQRELNKELAFGKKLLETLSYLRFLKYGPAYASDLDRTLGVTMRDDSYEHCTSRPSETLIVSKPSVRDCW